MCRHCELLLSEQEASLRGLQGQGSLLQLPTVLPLSGEHDEWIVSTVQETAMFVLLIEVMNRHPRRRLLWNHADYSRDVTQFVSSHSESEPIEPIALPPEPMERSHQPVHPREGERDGIAGGSRSGIRWIGKNRVHCVRDQDDHEQHHSLLRSTERNAFELPQWLLSHQHVAQLGD